MSVERAGGSTSHIDVLDRVLDKGIVIDASFRVALVGMDVLTVEANVVVASIATYLRYEDAVADRQAQARAEGDGAEADRLEQRGGERVHPGDGTSTAMQEDRVAEINDYLVRHIPDVRVTNHYDFDREAQRFRVKHGRMVTHILFVDEAAVIHHSRDELNQLLDKAIHHLRLTAPEVEVRVTDRGVLVTQAEH